MPRTLSLARAGTILWGNGGRIVARESERKLGSPPSVPSKKRGTASRRRRAATKRIRDSGKCIRAKELGRVRELAGLSCRRHSGKGAKTMRALRTRPTTRARRIAPRQHRKKHSRPMQRAQLQLRARLHLTRGGVAARRARCRKTPCANSSSVSRARAIKTPHASERRQGLMWIHAWRALSCADATADATGERREGANT